MAREILVVGASGHVGGHLLPCLVRRYGKATCFVRPTSDRSRISLPGVRFVEGDLSVPGSLEAVARRVDAVVSLVVLHEFAEQLVHACQSAGVGRAIFISSTSIFTSLNAPTKQAKLAAEALVAESGLAYTLLRPTMIYGTTEDRNISRLVRLLRWSPLLLIPGDGCSLQQPIHVEDVAAAVMACLESEATVGKAYNLSGAEPISFNQLVDQTCEALGVRRLKIHLPLRFSMWGVRLGGLLMPDFLKEEQLLRLNEDKTFDHSAARDDFDFSPRSFAAGIRQQVALPERPSGERRPFGLRMFGGHDRRSKES